MENQSQGILSAVAKDDRYFLTMLGAFMSGIVLVIADDSAIFVRNVIAPSLIVYTMGSGLIAQIQRMVGIREERRQGDRFVGTPVWFFRVICMLHVLWFATFLIFIYNKYQ